MKTGLTQNRYHFYRILFVILPYFLLVLFLIPDRAACLQNPRVLVLHSYHVGFTWSDNLTMGIRSVFAKEAPEVELLFEYMDVKRIYDVSYLESLHRFIEKKYRNKKIDVIISADDHSLSFLLGVGKDLLPGVPVCFCAVNGYDPVKHKGNGRAVTGIVESIDIRGTLELILSLHPDVKNIAYVSDGSLTGKTLKASAEDVFKDYRQRLSFKYIEHRSMDQLQQDVAHLKKGTVVFAFIFSKDELGRIWSHEHNLERMAETCNVPIYSVWEFYLGHGIVGGLLTRGYAHGEEAAKMALAIIDGRKASEMPVIMQSPNLYMFDFRQLQRFNIAKSDLPHGATVLFKPFSVYEKYKYLIWTIIASMGSLLILIAFLVHDMVLRKRTERLLTESENRYRNVYETAPLAFVVWDRNCRIIEWNDRAEETFGWTRAEAMGNSFFDLIIPDIEKEMIEQVVQNLLNGRIETNIVNQNTTKTGDVIWCEWNNAILHDAEGRITAAISLGLDITDRIATEAELKKYRQHLEDLVESRTTELESKNKELETFTYSVSHDLKAPLRGIDGYSRLLQEEYGERLDQEGQAFLKNVRQSTEQMNQLIEDLLAYSRMERRDLHTASIELTPLIGLLTSERQHEIDSRQIEMRVNLPFERIQADADTVRQVVGNYLDNAIKFTWDEKQPVVEIGGSEDERSWKIWVKDNGIGFDSRYHDRIFQIFQRLHRIEDYPGTGVGLAIVRKAIERIGGRVWAESEPGAGATFYVVIPK